VNSKALKLESVSPLYNAKQGDLDVADVWGGVWDSGFATTAQWKLITRVKKLKKEHIEVNMSPRSGDPKIGKAKPPEHVKGEGKT
jgi:hypothetical protein